MAAGLSIKEELLNEFIKAFELSCSTILDEKDLVPTILIDVELNMTDINKRLINFLKYLEPYGPKNPKPKFISRGIHIEGNPKISIFEDSGKENENKQEEKH